MSELNDFTTFRKKALELAHLVENKEQYPLMTWAFKCSDLIIRMRNLAVDMEIKEARFEKGEQPCKSL